MRNQLSNCSAMCCLGFAKFHHDPGRLSHLPGLPELGGRSYHPVLEKSGLGVPGKATGREGLGVEEESYIRREAPLRFLRLSKTYDLLHGHVPLAGLPVFQVSLVVFFLFPFVIQLFPPLSLSSFAFHDHFFFLCSSPSLSLFFGPVNIFGIDNVGLRDRLRCEIFQKMNCS